MPPLQTEFDDLSTVVDNVHALFERWEMGGVASPSLDQVGREVLKLAIHEWIANLVQHADFGGRLPLIRLRVLSEGRRVRCVIEDNSEGFDLEAQAALALDVQETAPEPTERGRGLLMLVACTENLSYCPCPPLGADGGLPPWQRLEFWVASEGEGLGLLPLGPYFDEAPPHASLASEAWYTLGPAFGQEGDFGLEDYPSQLAAPPAGPFRPDAPPA